MSPSRAALAVRSAVQRREEFVQVGRDVVRRLEEALERVDASCSRSGDVRDDPSSRQMITLLAIRLRFAIVTPPAVSVSTPSVLAGAGSLRGLPAGATTRCARRSGARPSARSTRRPARRCERPCDRSGLTGVTSSAPSRNAGRRTGRASLGLRAEHAVRLLFDRADRDQLAERSGELREERAARDRDHHVIGQRRPAELLGRLEPERLDPRRSTAACSRSRTPTAAPRRPRCRADSPRRSCPSPPRPWRRRPRWRGSSRARGPRGRRRSTPCRPSPRARRWRSRGCRSRRTDRLVAERARHRDRDAHHPILEGFDGLTESSLIADVLQAERGGEVVGAAERREPGPQVDPVDRRAARQQRLVAPERLAPSSACFLKNSPSTDWRS